MSMFSVGDLVRVTKNTLALRAGDMGVGVRVAGSTDTPEFDAQSAHESPAYVVHFTAKVSGEEDDGKFPHHRLNIPDNKTVLGKYLQKLP